MKQIDLTPYGVACVDDADFAILNQYRWQRFPNGTKMYARRLGAGPHDLMHRFLMGANPLELVDHVDGDGLNNQRSNLRLTDRSGNAANSTGHRDRLSPYKGVVELSNGKFAAYCGGEGKRYLGQFDTAELAARAYDVAAVDRFGQQARTNFEAGGPTK